MATKKLSEQLLKIEIDKLEYKLKPLLEKYLQLRISHFQLDCSTPILKDNIASIEYDGIDLSLYISRKKDKESEITFNV